MRGRHGAVQGARARERYLGAGLGSVHDGMAPVHAEGVAQLFHALLVPLMLWHRPPRPLPVRDGLRQPPCRSQARRSLTRESAIQRRACMRAAGPRYWSAFHQ